MSIFEPGSHVVHIRHGAGVVLEARSIAFEDEIRRYFCVELCTGGNLLMIPFDQLDEEEFRPAMDNTEIIEEVLSTTPEELSDNPRTRQADIRVKMNSRDPLLMAQALRDLAWRAQVRKLSGKDAELRDQIQRMLSQELSLRPALSFEDARFRVGQIVRSAIEHHFDVQTQIAAI